ncbi:hypothetical protein [Stackebrandtia albiflava]|uniref:hypothetical protein n=1 Tax=Stackebrandtia albiflava TaxID=406432 RepID=UPI0011BF9894|nr:hypothetical protein [Stackebrandtia albiflava]
MNEDTDYAVVTTDPETQAIMRAQDLDSIDLARWAVSHGMTPPGYREGQRIPAIIEVFPPENPEGVYAWDVHELDDAELGEGLPPYDD